MNYILCSVLWNGSADRSVCTASLIAAAKLSEDGNVLDSREFEGGCNEVELIKEFACWCGSDYMLCFWDGSSAGKMKKLLSSAGINHPYVHMYHLSGVFELSVKKCTDPSEKRKLQSAREHKPAYYGRKSSAAAELRWMCGIFPLLDFSAADKTRSLTFTEQPSNKYFVFRNGKCFHSKECSIVRSAAVSSLRAYTYYSTVTDAGFTPCSRCRPTDMDEQTASEMRRINKERLDEVRSKYRKDSQPRNKKRRTKTMNVFRSLEHMCGMYGIGYRKSGEKVFISAPAGEWYIVPESSSIELFCRCPDGEYRSDGNIYPDPYEAVRAVLRRIRENDDKK